MAKSSVVSEEKIFFKFHPPFSIFNLAAILVGSRDHRTQIWKGAIQGSFHQSFVARKCPNLNCISIMMSFLTYITGFFMNFEVLPILTDYANKKKGGMELKKNLLL
jgi:hypothetical protein